MGKIPRLLIAFLMFGLLAANAKPTDSLRVELRGGTKYIVHRVLKTESLNVLASRYAVSESEIISANPLVSAEVKRGQVIFIPLNIQRYGDVQPAIIKPVIDGELPLATSLPQPTAPKNNTTLIKPTDINIVNNQAKNIETLQEKTGKILRKEINGTDTFAVYQVGSENNITKVAKAFNVDDGAVKNYNKLESNLLKENQVVKVRLNKPLAITTNNVVSVVEPKPAVKSQEVKPVNQNVIAKKTFNYTTIIYNGKEAISYKVNSGDNINDLAAYFKTSADAIKRTNKLNATKLQTGKILTIFPGSDFNTNVNQDNIKQTAKNKPANNIAPDALKDDKLAYDKNEGIKNIDNKKRLTPRQNEILTANALSYNVADYRDDAVAPDAWADNMAKTYHVDVDGVVQSEGQGDVNTTHVVTKGETLQSIAKLYQVRVSDLINWNKLDAYRVRVGQDIIINQRRYDENYYTRNSFKPSLVTNRIEYIKQSGLCYFDSQLKFIGVLHDTLPAGKLIKIVNNDNSLETYARVTGKLPEMNDANIIIAIDNRIAEELKINNSTVKVTIKYGIID